MTTPAPVIREDGNEWSIINTLAVALEDEGLIYICPEHSTPEYPVYHVSNDFLDEHGSQWDSELSNRISELKDCVR